MDNQLCAIHNVEMNWKTGNSKSTGRPYAFWSCSEKMPDGSWCPWKPGNNKQRTPSQNFSQDLKQSSAAMDQEKKQAAKELLITRTAIAKSMIERGDKYGLETFNEFRKWVDVCLGKNPLANAPAATTSPVEAAPMPKFSPPPEPPEEEQVNLDSIPF